MVSSDGQFKNDQEFCTKLEWDVNLFLHIAYVGITTAAPIRRLRKHITDAMSTSDCATLHIKLSTTELAHWGIIPLQYITEDFFASVQERWWYVFRNT